MKPSKYNFFYPYKKNSKSNFIAYNSLTSSLALIEEDNYEQYLSFANKGEFIKDEELLNSFKLGGFILDEHTDELELIRHDMYETKFNSKVMSLTIAPTSNCNFRCIYCYEKNTIIQNSMSKETSNHIINLLNSKAQNLEMLYITWYGGEPLLEIETIEYLSNKFIEICDKNNIKYKSNIITNGYLMNSEIYQILRKNKIDRIQITIDGDEKVHNKRRPLSDGGATFQKIINNLEMAKDYDCLILLRINIDQSNYRGVFRVLDILKEKGLEKLVFPYLGMVRNMNNCYSADNCMNVEEYALVLDEFLSYRNHLGFKEIIDKYKLPAKKNNFCSAEQCNSYLINSDGAMYKCWENIGDAKFKVGNIKDGVQKNTTYLNYIMSDPTLDKKCSTCKYLPICFSGCPNHRKQEHMNKCALNRPNLERILNSIVNGYYESL